MHPTKPLASADTDAKHTEIAAEILQRLIPASLDTASPAVRDRFDNALLNIAVSRIIEIEGAERTATILIRLAEAVVANPAPRADTAIELTQPDA